MRPWERKRHYERSKPKRIPIEAIVACYRKLEDYMPVETHQDLINKASTLFGGEIIASTGYEACRDSLFAYVKANAANLPEVERWKVACRICWREMTANDPPIRDWAARILEHDLNLLLAKFHSAGLLKDHWSSDPPTWPVQPAKKA